MDGQDTETDRRGVAAGVGAYLMWGLFPLVFHRLQTVGAAEILLHRILWSLVVVLVLLAWRGPKGWARPLLSDRRQLGRLAIASGLVAVNWLVYIWAVNHNHVVEAALGYYVNPLLTVGLGVVVLGERLRRLQVIALVFGAASVVVLTVAFGRLPWIALVLAVSFAGYGFQKQGVSVAAAPSLAVETAILAPVALVVLAVLELHGRAAFGHGPIGRSALLVGLGVVTAAPLLLFAEAARRIPLSMLGLLQYLTPTGQLLCGVLLLGETLTPVRVAGFVLVWIGLLFLAVDAIRTSRRRTDALAVHAQHHRA
ncbi:MAG: EamA family transporter RarD [Actinomycetota bacterium]|nr:EamA family transporter RarD [Actinomycetota bacterium]MDQ6946314.1 EamA family transporter RarD [Actinomycetota bacterium]